MRAKNKIYLFELALSVFIIIYFICLRNIEAMFQDTLLILFLSISTIILYKQLDFKKDKNYLTSYVLRAIIESLLGIGIIIYLLGLIVGFQKSLYSSNFLIQITNLIKILLIYGELELIRYLIVSKYRGEKSHIIIYTILMVILDIVISINLKINSNVNLLFIYMCITVIPSISENILSTFLTKNYYSYKPSLIYRYILHLYLYIVPIVPNLGNYLFAVIHTIIPFIVYRVSLKYIKSTNKREDKKDDKKNFKALTIILIIMLSVLTILVSGIFQYKLIAIATDSMSPTFSRGDAIIYKKVDPRTIKKGDIVAVEVNKIIITHRVTKIKEVDGVLVFSTKGDNNNTEDAFKIEEGKVLGEVQTIIKYIGYPTVWFASLLERR